MQPLERLEKQKRRMNHLKFYALVPPRGDHCRSDFQRQCRPSAMHGVSISILLLIIVLIKYRLLRRIEGHSDHKREPLNELQADIPALEVLNDVNKLLHEVSPSYLEVRMWTNFE